MVQRPPRRPPGDDGDFLDEGELIETDDSLISDFDDLEEKPKAPPRRPAPSAPRPPSQQFRAPAEPPRAPVPRPPSRQVRVPQQQDDLDLPDLSPMPRAPRAVALNRPAEEAVSHGAANIGSSSAETDMVSGMPAADGFRLVMVEGANKGEEYSLERDVIGLGRGADNDIVIRDVSVSRKHAKIIREDGDYRLVDLGSGNGTLLNGRRVSDEKLISGSVFKMGNSAMRFVAVGDVYSTREDICDSGLGFAAPEAVPAPAAAPRRADQPVTAVGAPRAAAQAGGGKSKAILLWGTLAVVLFLSVAAVVKFVLLAPDGGGVGTLAKGPDPLQVQKLFDEGVEAFKRQDWKSAGEKFAAILGSDPANERARQYKTKIEEEIDYRDSLAQSREFVAKKILRAAIENLKKIPTESSYGPEARALLVQYKDEYTKARIGEGRGLLEDRKFQPAFEAFAEVLTVDPSNSEAIRLKSEAEDAIKKGGQEVVAYTPPKPVRDVKTGGEKPPSSGGKPPKEPKPPREVKTGGRDPAGDDMPAAASTTPGPASTGPVAQKAVGIFRQGNVSGAIQSIESSGAGGDPKLGKLMGDLRGFAQALQEGEGYYRGKQDEGAIKALGQAIAYGKAIAPSGENAYAQKIAGMIADMYYLRGVKAFYKENYLIAAQNFQQALKFKPDHQQSQTKLKEMSAVAGRLYEEGYVLKAADPEGAKKKFQTILQITPPDNDYHKKAKDWLKRL